jgi:hypothetical protein
MNVEELIDELQRFDSKAVVVVVVDDENSGLSVVRDVGRRERPSLGAHPAIYLRSSLYPAVSLI